MGNIKGFQAFNSYICGQICSGCEYFRSIKCVSKDKKYCRNKYAYSKLMGKVCNHCGQIGGVCVTFLTERLGREYVQDERKDLFER